MVTDKLGRDANRVRVRPEFELSTMCVLPRGHPNQRQKVGPGTGADLRPACMLVPALVLVPVLPDQAWPAPTRPGPPCPDQA